VDRRRLSEHSRRFQRGAGRISHQPAATTTLTKPIAMTVDGGVVVTAKNLDPGTHGRWVLRASSSEAVAALVGQAVR
jgi:hypothetical protein